MKRLIKKNALKKCICYFLLALPFNAMLIYLLIIRFNDWIFFNIDTSDIFNILPLLFLVGRFDFMLIRYIKIFLNPLENMVYKIYGSEERVNHFLTEIDETVDYIDDEVIVSKRFLLDRDNCSFMFYLEDIIVIYQMRARRGCANILVVKDKYGRVAKLKYSDFLYKQEVVEDLLKLLIERCPNAIVGFSGGDEENLNHQKVDVEFINRRNLRYLTEDEILKFQEKIRQKRLKKERELQKYDNYDEDLDIDIEEEDLLFSDVDEIPIDDWSIEEKADYVARVYEFENWDDMKNNVYVSKNIENIKKFSRDEELDFISILLGYDDFEDLFYTTRSMNNL
ncbi:MAG: hypothetical protein MR598_04095 [Erysipelotrichaceae bacterium]|nr:hypothetical protein [Erysipelotrichaceae bacterium]